MQETWVRSLGRADPWRRKWQPTPVLLPGKSHGQGSRAGYSPWSRKESDATAQLPLSSVPESLSACLEISSWPCGFWLNGLHSGVGNSTRPSKASLHFCFLAESLIKLIHLNCCEVDKWMSVPSPLYNKGSKSFSKWNLRQRGKKNPLKCGLTRQLDNTAP